MRFFSPLILVLIAKISFFILPAQAQTSPQLNSSEILLHLQKLQTVGSVLYVAAHPDDENTRLLAYLAKEKKLRTAYLSITRGDGGQNLIGKEQGDALGLIRTQELLQARRIDGAEQFFTRANDFGYSKTPEETLNIWNKDNVLADVVWAIRKFKPDVIICRFPTTGEGGHGHHTASAMLAEEAFEAAANPQKYPQQLQYVSVWQAKSLFWNTFNFGTTNTTAENQLKIDVGAFNPLLGKSFGEIASESRSMHKSQGFGSARGRGEAIEYFKLLKNSSTTKQTNQTNLKTDLFEGIDLTWKRLNLPKIDKIISEIIKKYNPLAPNESVNDLVLLYKNIQNIPEKTNNDTPQTDISYWKTQKLKELEVILISCAGLWAEAYAGEFSAVASAISNSKINITTQIISRNQTLNNKIILEKIAILNQKDTITNLSLDKNKLFTFKFKADIKADIATSNPYWLNDKHEIGEFNVSNLLLIGTPENDSKSLVVFYIDINGLKLALTRPLTYKSTDPVKGEIYRPFEVLPPATVNISENVFVFPDKNPKNIQIIIKANASNISGKLELKAPSNFIINIKSPNFTLKNKNEELIIDAIISLKNPTEIVSGKLEASLNINGENFNKSIKRIEYDHIPYQFILSNAESTLISINVQKKGTQIGYIVGAGDDIPTCLRQIGYNVTLLSDEMLTNDNLSKYDAILTGVRAYNTNDRLQIHYEKLMQYIKNGGNLVVQYNTNNRIGPVLAKIAPFPFTISRERITDEKAQIRFLKPTHSVVTTPNMITEADFDGWVQERGIYFATDIDKSYETIFSMNDKNEKPNDNSLIIAKYGKGNFVYTGLAFFRQLPAGVSGSYRLMANLLGLPQN